MAIRSRRLKTASIEKGLPEDCGYCRVCQEVKLDKYFFKAVDNDLDKNGLMSVCRPCIDEMYASILSSENGSIQKTILRLCKMLNVLYDSRAIESSIKQIESKGSDPMKIFGYYRAKLLVLNRTDVRDTNVDLTYQHDTKNDIMVDETKFQIEEYKDMDELRKFWGKGFEPEEIMILEEKFADYSQTNSIDTHPEKVLLKYICLKEYEIDKAMDNGGSTANLTKEYQELLKSANISPSSITASNVGKSQESWGMFIKTIEETTPAEYFKDDNLFKDYDNIEYIWNRYIVRSIKNFITGSRDFNVEDIDSEYDTESEDESNNAETTPQLEYKPEE